MSSQTEQTVGGRLRAERERQKLALKDVEAATNIRVSYLERIEKDDGSLPNDPYTRGFIHNYGHFLGLDGAKLAKEFEFHQGDALTAAAARLQPLSGPRFIITPQLLVTLFILTVLGAISAYIIYQLSFLAAAPRLEVTEPPADREAFVDTIKVSGKTSAGSDVFINDTLIVTGDDGRFSSDVTLQPGVNSVRVSAKNRTGKTSEVVRSVLFKAAAEELPTTNIDGVAVKVTATEAVTVTARVDGVNVFSGTLLPGSSKVFRGATKVVIGTTNAAVTSLNITNQVTANKQFGQVGTEREQKQNLEFNKDTQFAQ